jgi:hypothetical protein
MTNSADSAGGGRYALDIGSTVVKLAQLDQDGGLARQHFFPRDFAAGIAAQVDGILSNFHVDTASGQVLVCSSANGGLRVGIVCLTKDFSGAALRNQVLLAGANPEYVYDFGEAAGDSRRVDILLVGGGIDCADAAPAARRLASFDAGRFRFGTLVYAGNRFLADDFVARHPYAVVIENPLRDSLTDRAGGVFEAVRRAYLDDLVYKEGVSELRHELAHGIRPTPEVASRGFLRAVQNRSSFTILGACVVIDIGGATTDLHYTVEIVRDDSPVKPSGGVSVARYVFTDLGIVASRDTLLMRLRAHPRVYEFLAVVLGDLVQEAYALLREGEYEAPAEVLSYACLFLALDRFAQGRGPGLPVGDLERIAQVILTGGAAQILDEALVQRLMRLWISPANPVPTVQIDRRYEIWVGGITWLQDAPR